MWEKIEKFYLKIEITFEIMYEWESMVDYSLSVGELKLAEWKCQHYNQNGVD